MSTATAIDLGYLDALASSEPAPSPVGTKQQRTARPSSPAPAEKVDEQRNRWPEPLLFEAMDHAPELDPCLLPPWLNEYTSELSRETQVPVSVAVLLGLSVLGACLAKKYIVRRYEGHREALNVWTVAVLPPSARKSAIFGAMTAPIYDWQVRQQGEVKREGAKRKATRKAMEYDIEQIETRMQKAGEPERTHLADRIADITMALPGELHPPCLIASDATIEGLALLMNEQHGRIAVMSDEGGVFKIMKGLYSKGRPNVDNYLKGYTGSAPITVKRVSKSLDVPNPAITMGLAVQPHVLAEIHGNKEWRGNGLLSRFMYAVPRNIIGTRDVNPTPMANSIRTAYAANIERLLAAEVPSTPTVLTLEGEAEDIWLAFSDELEKRMHPMSGDLAVITDWVGKLAGNTLRIAGLLHIAAQADYPGFPRIETEIGEEWTAAAISLCRSLIPHAMVAYGAASRTDADEDAQAVLRWIRQNVTPAAPYFSVATLHSAMSSRLRTLDERDAALEVLERRHIVSAPRKARNGGKGRPSLIREVNPDVLVKEAGK